MHAVAKNYITLFSSIILLTLPFSFKITNIQFTYELMLSFLKTFFKNLRPTLF